MIYQTLEGEIYEADEEYNITLISSPKPPVGKDEFFCIVCQQARKLADGYRHSILFRGFACESHTIEEIENALPS